MPKGHFFKYFAPFHEAPKKSAMIISSCFWWFVSLFWHDEIVSRKVPRMRACTAKDSRAMFLSSIGPFFQAPAVEGAERVAAIVKEEVRR